MSGASLFQVAPATSTNKKREKSPDGVNSGIFEGVCVECLIGKQKKLTLFKVTEPSSIPYRTPACAKRAAYPDPTPVILLPESIAAQAAYQLSIIVN